MLIHPTIDRLRALGLAAMADTVVELQNNPEAAGIPHADWLGLLVDREATARDNRRITRRLTSAKLRQAAAIENVDYRTARGLDRSLFQNLGTCQWIRDANHLVIVGPTGTGKSWLACARWADDDQVIGIADPLAGAEVLEERTVETTGGTIVDVLVREVLTAFSFRRLAMVAA